MPGGQDPESYAVITVYPTSSGINSVPTPYPGSGGGAAWLQANFQAVQAAFADSPLEVPGLQGGVISTTYPSTDPNPYTVSTPYQQGWTPAQWWEAHKANVREAADPNGDHPIVLPS